MRIGLVGPSYTEIDHIVESLENRKEEKRDSHVFYSGTLGNEEVVSVVSGIGKVNAAIAAQRLIDLYKVDALFLCGVAGAIADLPVFSLVLCSKAAHHDVAEDILDTGFPFIKDNILAASPSLTALAKEAVRDFSNVYEGLCVSGEQFIDQEGRDAIIQRFHPLCVDMETSAVAHAAYLKELPWFAMRGITDTGNESGMDVFRQNLRKTSDMTQNAMLSLFRLLSERGL